MIFTSARRLLVLAAVVTCTGAGVPRRSVQHYVCVADTLPYQVEVNGVYTATLRGPLLRFSTADSAGVVVRRDE